MKIIEDFREHIKDHNEGTSYPYWIIIDPRQNMRMSPHEVAGMITGPFLSREDAKAHLARRHYAFSDRAVVYCHSGYQSAAWRHICEGDE